MKHIGNPIFNDINVLSKRVPEVLGKHYEISYPGRQWNTSRNLKQMTLHKKWKKMGAFFGQVNAIERPLFFNCKRGPELTFKEGNTYIFDISDSSVAAHPFAFSDGTDGSASSYTTNVTDNGTTIEITIDDTTPDLNYYCTAHPGMGSSAEVSLINFGNFILAPKIWVRNWPERTPTGPRTDPELT